jgi:hypothetical protein
LPGSSATPSSSSPPTELSRGEPESMPSLPFPCRSRPCHHRNMPLPVLLRPSRPHRSSPGELLVPSSPSPASLMSDLASGASRPAPRRRAQKATTSRWPGWPSLA